MHAKGSAADSRSGKFNGLVKVNRSTEEDSNSMSDSSSEAEFSGDSEDSDEAENAIAEQVANLVYNSGRDEADINYDHY